MYKIYRAAATFCFWCPYELISYSIKNCCASLVIWYTVQKENKRLRGRAEGGYRSLGPCARTHICSTYVCRLFAQFASLQGEPDCDVVRRCSSVSRAVQFTLKQHNCDKQSASFWSADMCGFVGKTSVISHTLRNKVDGF